MLINVIGNHENFGVINQYPAQGLQLGLGIARSGWIAGTVQDKQPRLVSDRRSNLCRSHLEILVNTRGDDNRLGTRKAHHIRV